MISPSGPGAVLNKQRAGTFQVLFLKVLMPNLCHVIHKKRKRGRPGEEWLNCVPFVNYRAPGQNNSIVNVSLEGEQWSDED